MKSADAETDRVRHAAARFRVRKALAMIEDAQRQLGRAQAELATVQFGSPAWGRVGKLYDRVHAEWYKTSRLLEDARIRIDRDPTDEERAFHAPAAARGPEGMA